MYWLHTTSYIAVAYIMTVRTVFQQHISNGLLSDRQIGSYWTSAIVTNPFIHSFIPVISIAPFQVLYYSEALPTTARILYRSFTPKCTGNCRYRTCPRSLRGGKSGSRTHDPPVESYRLNQGATTSMTTQKCKLSKKYME